MRHTPSVNCETAIAINQHNGGFRFPCKPSRKKLFPSLSPTRGVDERKSCLPASVGSSNLPGKDQILSRKPVSLQSRCELPKESFEPSGFAVLLGGVGA